jgi:hypothetical protein
VAPAHAGWCYATVLLLVRKYTSSIESATSRMIAIGQFCCRGAEPEEGFEPLDLSIR